MSDLNNNPAARYGGAVRTGAEIDQGLRSYMLGVYNYMTIGLAITGLFALGIYMLSISNVSVPGAILLKQGVYMTSFGQTLFLTPLKYVVMFAPLALVFFLGFRIEKMSAGAAQLTFWIYAALVGVSLATILMVFTPTSIARAFFISAASFGALSLYGYTTKRDLSQMATFLVMGLIGVIIASIVNIWLASSMLQWIVSIAGLLVFAGFTAYDTQDIKNMYDANDDSTAAGRKSIMGALRLYLDFLNIFLFLLQIIGNRE
ncbi:MAG TPA: Bax inhibitor-1/YccA family protein [Xanthobacteraceae bacterium]|nr:Bax inhibitor-1/YccA family protein [Xanthobacteraceae bacterium]